MRAYNALDFDGLIEKAVQLFEKFPSLLDTYSFKYIMIDEYQDTNPMQYRLATLLSKKHGNLCVVGDDDQSIYGWRGACVKNILDFPADTTVKLEQNYRSTPLIIKASNHLIKHNETRHSKTLFTSLSSDEKIEIFHAPSERDEAEGVIDRLLYLKKTKDYKWSDFAILYRSNILARPIEASLLHRKIPYQMFGGLELFERAEIKDLISYLKWIANPKDTESLLRIINYPRRGISNQTLDLLTKDSRAQEIPLMEFIEKIFDDVDYPLTGQGRDGLKRLLILFKEAKTRFESNPLKESTEWLIEEIGYKKQIDSEAKSEKARAFKWENIQYCLKELEAYEKEEKDPTLYDFVSSTQLGSKDIQHETEKPKDKVNLMTFHSAKGLEFPVCFLIGLEDHILPHEKSLLETGIEEERRLFYVAMTRAKKTLVLSMARKRPRFGKEANSSPSRFLFEIPQETMQVSSWRLIQGKT